MAFPLNRVIRGDSVELLKRIPAGSIDLAFADPPFNIGYDYDVYQDDRAPQDYLDWSRRWIKSTAKALKPTGTMWIAIGDEYAAELKLIAQNDAGLQCRSWVIWYYTFGVNCRNGFSRSHTHLFHFVKDPKRFTFNSDNPTVRVPSARQLVYGDLRANPRGRLPDNTWILRPQDVQGSFAPDHDTWYFARVAGTFKEREGFHGCQMPEQLLGRIIRTCSNSGDSVLDPFAGSGTTLTVAKKLGRQWIGFELSEDYAAHVQTRVGLAEVGDPLDGPEDPLRSAPTTRAGRTLESRQRAKRKRAGTDDSSFFESLIGAYTEAGQGLSVDHLLADPDANAEFVAACQRSSLAGRPVDWNRSLLKLRKRGKLPKSDRRANLSLSEADDYFHASEVAMHLISVEMEVTLDTILCDPQWAARFDRLAATFAPGFRPFDYRWAGLALRKGARSAKNLAVGQFAEWQAESLPAAELLEQFDAAAYEAPGVYVLESDAHQVLYVGQTDQLRRRVAGLRTLDAWLRFAPAFLRFVPLEKRRAGLQSRLVGRLNPILNLRLLRPRSVPAEWAAELSAAE